jgi:hypothetical protein
MIADLNTLIKELSKLREEHGNVEVSICVLGGDGISMYEDSIKFISYEYSGKLTIFGEGIAQ